MNALNRVIATTRPIRNRLAAALNRAAKRVATDQGWARLMNEMGAPSMMGGLERLRRRGVVPQRIIDGGACRGDWTVLTRCVFPEAEILMIEPQTRHAEALKQVCRSLAPGVHYAPQLIGPEEQAAINFVVLDDDSGGTGSSVLPENSDVPRHVVSLPMTTLDNLVATTGFGHPDFIKLDVQGYELAVLEGASECLLSADLVLLEVSLWPYNVSSPLAAEVMAWMDARGFQAFEVVDISRRASDGIVVQIDVLFMRKTYPLLQDVLTRFSGKNSIA